MTTDVLGLLAPEILLAGAAVAICVAGTFVAARGRWAWVAAAAIVGAGVLLAVRAPAGPAGPLAADALACFGRWLALLAGLGLVLSVARVRLAAEPEYLGSLLLAVVGLMLLAAAVDLVLLLVGLELIAISTCLMLYLDRRDTLSAQTAAKYFFLGVLALALLLYGLSFLYGMAGSTDLGAIRAALAATNEAAGRTPLTGLAGVAIVFLVAGLGLKMAAVPFHFHAPDVYQQTTHANAALLSVVPKAAGFLILARVLVAAMPATLDGCRLAMLLAVLGMTVGNLMALRQNNLRRLLAYASIAETGYLLLGLSVAMAAGAKPMRFDAMAGAWFYLAAGSLAMLGTFAALAYLGRTDRQVDHVDELAGLGRTHPAMAASMAVLLLSLAGVPPLAGFWGKLALLAAALEVDPVTLDGATQPRVWFIVLAVVGVLNVAVAAAYYLRIVGVIYFRLPLGVLRAEGGRAARAVVFACALLTVGIGLHAGPLWHWATQASRSVPAEAEWPEQSSGTVVNPR